MGKQLPPAIHDANPSGASKQAAASAKEWARPDEELGPMDRAKRLHPGGSAGTSKVPFPVADRDAYLAMTREAGSIAQKTHGAPIALVNLSDLHAIQNTINDERLEQHLASPDMVAPGTRGSGHGGLVDKPVVVRKDGILYIHDGHHRLTAAAMRGQDTAKVRLVDLDGEHLPGADRAS
jgi:hypothetical protein